MLFPFRVSLMLLFIFGGAGAITACNTIEGAGKDVDAAGKGITRGAKEVKKDM
jgi:predicted small secreted protein